MDGVRKLALSCSPEVGDNRNECFLNANSSYERAILDSFYVWLSRFTYRPFTLEGNFGFARAIQEMLLSYDSNTKEVRLFRALPKEWDGKEVSFRSLRVPGGCRISARRAADGKVSFTAEGRLPGPVLYNGHRVSGDCLLNNRALRF